jgi:hypothetical protein
MIEGKTAEAHVEAIKLYPTIVENQQAIFTKVLATK